MQLQYVVGALCPLLGSMQSFKTCGSAAAERGDCTVGTVEMRFTANLSKLVFWLCVGHQMVHQVKNPMNRSGDFAYSPSPVDTPIGGVHSSE